MQNNVQSDPTETNDASQSKMTTWNDISFWFIEEVQEKEIIKGSKRSLHFANTCFHKLGELGFPANFVKSGFILVRFRRSSSWPQ